MEGVSRNKKECPQLLDFIHRGRQSWLKRGEAASLGDAEEKKLELRLAPPGENWVSNKINHPKEEEKDEPSLSFGCYSSMVHNHVYTNTNTWLTNQSHKFLSCEKAVFSTPYASNPSVYQMKAMESSKTRCTKVVGENNNSQKRSAPAPVVGWPPVRSFRKNVATTSSTKQAGYSQNGDSPKEDTKEERCNNGMFVKINMDGVPIGRKVDLRACNGYEKLSSAVDELFRDLLAAQRDSLVTGNLDKVEDIKEITGLLDGSGEYTLVYEDNEGDRMLVGDVPWDMFVLTVKRLRVIKSSELSVLRGSGGKQRKIPL